MRSVQPGLQYHAGRSILRLQYREQIEKWDPALRLTPDSSSESGQDVERQPIGGGSSSEGLSILYEGLKLHVDSAPLPYMRRTVWEYAVPAAAIDNALAWWNSLPGLLVGYGFEMIHLDGEDVQLLAHWVFNPELL